MKALITGASSGIGRDMARILSKYGYDLILVARRKARLEELKKELKTDVRMITMDISTTYHCMKLYNLVKEDEFDIVINNAGYGVFGEFSKTDLNHELDMIDLNVKTVHTLTKLFLNDMRERNKGYILNVASSAAFMPGPLMASYYATKSYVLRLTEAIYEELKREGSSVSVSVLCPGPVGTEFNKVAGVEFGVKALTSASVAKYAIDKMFQKKLVIVPGFTMKFIHFIIRFLPLKLILHFTYHIQKAKK